MILPGDYLDHLDILAKSGSEIGTISWVSSAVEHTVVFIRLLAKMAGKESLPLKSTSLDQFLV